MAYHQSLPPSLNPPTTTTPAVSPTMAMFKPAWGLLLMVPFLLFILHAPTNNSEQVVLYADSRGAQQLGDEPLSNAQSSSQQQQPSPQSYESSKQFSSNNNNDVNNIVLPSDTSSNNNDESLMSSPEALQSSSSSSSSMSEAKCICDSDKPTSNSDFTPNQPLFRPGRRIIFLITPTYTRPSQMPDMTRLGQTLKLVSDVYWIVVEDSVVKTKSVIKLLERINIPYVHLLGPRPVTHMDRRSGRGVSNRLRAFEWLRQHYTGSDQQGVIYFADDDNAYDTRLFDELRTTQKVSMFPVGMIGTLGMSTPIVSSVSGKIIGFHDPFIGRRKFAVDMAGFAVGLQYFLSVPKATMPYKVGYEEDYFLKSLGVKIWELEVKANNCTEILVWHTKTKPGDTPKLTYMQKVTHYQETNLPTIYANLMDETIGSSKSMLHLGSK